MRKNIRPPQASGILDGFIAREDGGLDWLPADGGADHGYTDFIATVDAIVMGRNTYEIVLGFGSWPYPEMPVIVLTTRPLERPVPAGAHVDVMAGPPHDIVARLAARGMKHLYVDGGITVQRFLAAGLIQRFTITRIPVLLGRGIPLFGPVPHDIPVRTRRHEHVRGRDGEERVRSPGGEPARTREQRGRK